MIARHPEGRLKVEVFHHSTDHCARPGASYAS
jgi:hypothetical protein